jgi:hypothetical protein
MDRGPNFLILCVLCRLLVDMNFLFKPLRRAKKVC